MRNWKVWIAFFGFASASAPLLAEDKLNQVESMFRVAVVAPAKGVTTKAHQWTNPDGVVETIEVHDPPVLMDDDVAAVEYDPKGGRAMLVTFTAEGLAKLRKAGERMQLGRDRIAIFYEDQLVAVPVLQATTLTTWPFPVPEAWTQDKRQAYTKRLNERAHSDKGAKDETVEQGESQNPENR